jgi:predicted transcriptional regulator
MTFDLAAHIRQLRSELGWTQEDLAKRARIDQAEVSRIETGGLDPRWSTVNKIINALGETFELNATPTTIRPALSAESRAEVRRLARTARPKREALGPEPIVIKR